MRQPETVARPLTAPGEGGIGVIALEGPDAVRILDSVFCGTARSAAELAPGRIAHGTIRWDEETVDEVIVAHYHPRDRDTEQDYFEVNCHGGAVAVRSVLRCLGEAGARMADEDEGGQPSADVALSPRQIRRTAERLLRGIPTRLGAVMLLHQLDGALEAALREAYTLVEDRSPGECERLLEEVLGRSRLGRALVEPPMVALLGPPNVGKSTLLNALSGEDRAIVHHEPGTTRDTVSATVSVRGVPFEIVDTAGIRRTDHQVEALATRRSAEAASRCDVAVLVFDGRGNEGPSPTGLKGLRPGARVIAVANKMDLVAGDEPVVLPRYLPPDAPVIPISALEGRSLQQLDDALLQPYREHLQHVRNGAPVAFCKEIEAELRGVLDDLRAGRLDAVRAALSAFG